MHWFMSWASFQPSADFFTSSRLDLVVGVQRYIFAWRGDTSDEAAIRERMQGVQRPPFRANLQPDRMNAVTTNCVIPVTEISAATVSSELADKTA